MSNTVSQVVSRVRDILEGEFRSVSIEGEVSNLTSSKTGHWYFTLSDRDAGISAALFVRDAVRNPIINSLKNGDKIVCSGKIGVYVKRGTFQIIANRIELAGKGDLKAQYERLKRQLSNEGLFDQATKKQIPTMAKNVAVITSENGAALQDFLNIYERRSLWMNVLVSPALVQGDSAPASIIQALHKIIKFSMNQSEDKKIDVIVLTRGGGSLEDLWAFNDEALAYEIYNCPIPIVSAVGHEVDYTISDYVADMRLETPSAAAEYLTQEMLNIKMRISKAKGAILQASKYLLLDLNHRVEKVRISKLRDYVSQKMYDIKLRMERVSSIKSLDNFVRITDLHQRLDQNVEKLFSIINSKIEENKLSLENKYTVLKVLDPKNVLDRGYSIIEDDNNSIISSVKQFEKVSSNSSMKIIFSDGSGEVLKK